jgi:SAM-dependent methyltransferase
VATEPADGGAPTPRERLRAAFEQVPEQYDRARPRYPTAVFDDLVGLARLRTGARLLEIGCGTGRATSALAERGLAITCVELGGRLAAVARRTLARFDRVEVITADFETWQPGRPAFDAVVAFGAFHWIRPELRYAKAADLLRNRGKLAFVSTAHVLPPDGDRFFLDVQADYEAVVPHDPAATGGAFYSPPWRLPDPDALAAHSDAVVRAELEASGRFRVLGARRYLWDVVYGADDYLAVLDTYSHHRAFDDDARARLYDRIGRRIETRREPTVRATYLALLYVAERG